ncbi:MAG: putative HTH-type transcriptional regulator ybzH [Thermoleophilia bacterium]|nr:putative HTH-type transcriptional regulator ybzH [Thermoleophilia bacterium]
MVHDLGMPRPGTAADDRVTRLKALAHPDRLRLVELLGEHDRFPDNLVDTRTVGICVNDLATAAGLPQSNASHHLSILEKAGVVTCTRHGQWKYARPDPAVFDELAASLRDLGGLSDT